MILTRNKFSMNKILERYGFLVPKSICFEQSEFVEGQLCEKIAELSFPLVAKPQIGRLGNDVLCNIKNIEQLQNYMENNISRYEEITIEEFHGNLNAYRVLVLNNTILDVIERHPAHVIGDGHHNLQELIDLANQKRFETNDMLAPIVVDEECQIRLDELGIDLSYIPKPNEWLSLAYTCNASRGGTYKSLGKKSIAIENAKYLIRAAKELNLNLVGFDIQCKDINQPFSNTDVIIEANDAPSIRIHESPMQGSAVWVSKQIIRSLIFRHPLSYLHALYKNQRVGLYIKSLLLALLLGLAYLSFQVFVLG
ncbi:MAG: UDP-N-acetylmuramyl peptide synthase [Tatlockia sp.]|nr:UDP-N-acetylmuramyl peptide synthase [Tatlockia sp.]